LRQEELLGERRLRRGIAGRSQADAKDHFGTAMAFASNTPEPWLARG